MKNLFFQIFILLLPVTGIGQAFQNDKALPRQVVWGDIGLGVNSESASVGVKINTEIKQKYLASITGELTFAPGFLFPTVLKSYSAIFAKTNYHE